MNFEELAKMHKEMIEKSGGFELVSWRMLFQQIYFSISFCLDKDTEQKIDLKQSIGSPLFGFKPDIFLPSGCSLLGFPPKTCIEIKSRLIHNTLSLAIKRARDYSSSVGKYVLIYKDQGSVSDSVIQEVISDKTIEIHQVDDFSEFVKKKQAGKRIEKELIQKSNAWREERDQIVESARESFRCNKVSFFLGAGVSQDAGAPSWRELLHKVIKHFRRKANFTISDVKKISKGVSDSSIILGRYAFPQTTYHVNELSEYLRTKVLYAKKKDSLLIDAIVNTCLENANVESIITYNYDDLLEQGFERLVAGSFQRYESVYEKNRVSENRIPIYHVHGFVPEIREVGFESKPVLSEFDYHSIYREAFHWSNIEQLHALDRNVCFFIGLSMTDPNLRRLLDISKTNSDGTPEHYVFLQRCNIKFQKNSVEKNLYNTGVLEQMMQNLGVTIIWYENHNEIPSLIERITAKLQLIT